MNPVFNTKCCYQTIIQLVQLFNRLSILFLARYSRDACLKGDTPNIPKDHLFHRKKKPLILGHRGQGRQFQENTMEGIKSLIDTGADGFQADVVLTNYGQLVLFQSQNAKVNYNTFSSPTIH